MRLREKALIVKVVVLDIDGVLTDGRVGYAENDEVKFFHVRDGHGIKLAKRAGLKIGALSGRSAAANRRRAAELDFDFCYEGRKNKLEAFKELLAELDVGPEECLFIGDDVVDMPVLREAGVAVAVFDAASELDSVCDFRSEKNGGAGAVREILEWLLKTQGKWNDLMTRYMA